MANPVFTRRSFSALPGQVAGQSPGVVRRTRVTNGLGTDHLQLSVTDLRDQVALAERLTGKPVSFADDAELDAYLTSIKQALPQKQYDPDGFLANTLGLIGLRSAGKQDLATMRAIGRIDSYRPDNRLWGHRILPQQWLFDLARSHPSVFLGLTRLTNPLLEGPSRLKGLWKKRFHSRQPIIPTGVRPHDRYPEVNARKANGPLGFDQDFHSGVPTGTDPGTRYGTYAIARALGFSDDQARRLGRMDNGVDDNTTPYGKTSPYLMGQEDRHFNLAGSGEDTRLVWARRHLEQAIAFGRATSYDQAEVELGAGLHSLQDLFAHGQLTPSVHAVLGDFPDDVTRDPIAVVEATRATAAYLKVYLQALE